MKFSEADAGSGYLIEGYGAGWIGLSGRRYTRSLILTPSEIIEPWGPTSPADLTREHLTAIADFAPRVVLIGTGEQPALLDPRLYLSLLERGIGVEVMTTGAACRTYNILMAEGREVVAGLILEANG
ncbi:MAG: Mth938-like domain-containing protein [Chromatiales bacterium]|nr:Mth938-like domain-containing protein [Chromatiales bacterium]